MSTTVPHKRELVPVVENLGLKVEGDESHMDLLEAYFNLLNAGRSAT